MELVLKKLKKLSYLVLNLRRYLKMQIEAVHFVVAVSFFSDSIHTHGTCFALSRAFLGLFFHYEDEAKIKIKIHKSKII